MRISPRTEFMSEGPREDHRAYDRYLAGSSMGASEGEPIFTRSMGDRTPGVRMVKDPEKGVYESFSGSESESIEALEAMVNVVLAKDPLSPTVVAQLEDGEVHGVKRARQEAVDKTPGKESKLFDFLSAI